MGVNFSPFITGIRPTSTVFFVFNWHYYQEQFEEQDPLETKVSLSLFRSDTFELEEEIDVKDNLEEDLLRIEGKWSNEYIISLSMFLFLNKQWKKEYTYMCKVFLINAVISSLLW